MTKAQLETALRNQFLTLITESIQTALDTDVLPVSASEITIPCLDAEGNEKFVLVKVSIPRGTRNGQGGYDPYDGYAAAQDYADDCVEKAAKKADAEAKKQAKIARDERKRAEKKAVAEAQKNLKEAQKELRKLNLNPKKADEDEGDGNYMDQYEPHEVFDMLN